MAFACVIQFNRSPALIEMAKQEQRRLLELVRESQETIGGRAISFPAWKIYFGLIRNGGSILAYKSPSQTGGRGYSITWMVCLWLALLRHAVP